MNNLRNSVRLIGHLGQNPDVKSLNGGKKFAKCSLATSEYHKNENGEKVSETQWHNLVAWGKQADIIERFLKKGSEIAIEGKINNRSYTDKEGNKRYTSEIVVNELLMLSKKS
jgi:single-strand DNA-binding protein